MIIGLKNNYSSVTDSTKSIQTGTLNAKNEIAKIRPKLKNAYEGKVDFDSELSKIQKRLSAQADKMSALTKSINNAFSDIISADSQKIEFDIKDISFERIVVGVSSAINSMVSAFTSSSFGKLISSFYNKSKEKNGNGGIIVGGVTALTGIASIIKDKSTTTPDEFKKEHVDLADEVRKEDKKIQAEINRQKYIDNPELLTEDTPFQPQIHEVNKNGNPVSKSGRCNVAAATQLLNRKATLDGEGYFTAEDVFEGNGCTEIIKHSERPKGKDYTCEGYEYKGGTSYWAGKKYTNSEGISYKLQSQGATKNEIKRLANSGNIDGCYKEMEKILDDHPEGFCLRYAGVPIGTDKNGKPKTESHVVVVTDTIYENGKIVGIKVQDGTGKYTEFSNKNALKYFQRLDMLVTIK